MEQQAPAANSNLVAHTKHGNLTLDQIGEMQPGMARLMLEVSERFLIVSYAARAGNERANQYHNEFGKPSIEWQLPPTPPPYLKLDAQHAR